MKEKYPEVIIKWKSSISDHEEEISRSDYKLGIFDKES
jgi:hypothetical protein